MAKSRKQPNAVDLVVQTAKKLIDRAGTQTKLSKGVAQTTLSRLVRGGNPRLSTLQKLASSQDLQVWQLLVPDFDPLRPPRLAGEDGAGHHLDPEEVEVIANLRAIDDPAMKAVLTNAIENAATVTLEAKEPA